MEPCVLLDTPKRMLLLPGTRRSLRTWSHRGDSAPTGFSRARSIPGAESILTPHEKKLSWQRSDLRARSSSGADARWAQTGFPKQGGEAGNAPAHGGHLFRGREPADTAAHKPSSLTRQLLVNRICTRIMWLGSACSRRSQHLFLFSKSHPCPRCGSRQRREGPGTATLRPSPSPGPGNSGKGIDHGRLAGQAPLESSSQRAKLHADPLQAAPWADL